MKVDALIRAALAEDLKTSGDLSTIYFLPRNARLQARLIAKQDGVLCGRKIVDAVFNRAASGARPRWAVKEGTPFKKGVVLATITGGRNLLTAERTALNFLQHLCGIATLTHAFVNEIRGTRAKIYDTRKTLPGWRELAKYAVRIGGGNNHRQGLYDMVMLKDNHLAAYKDLDDRVRAFRKKHPRVKIEIEASNATEVELALILGADVIMLDNMDAGRLRRQIRVIRRSNPRVEIEISGGVSLKTVARLARLGPDRISVGRLTHSAPAIDISMKLAA
ncbi:MAG: nicotinate-nucleotide diphosphorylase (carboxylating) [Elusimicrobia bacterium]|nr:MAG: nicotinate-nucleotide diphosphorylase (carboxylating) [Elusimicrobiota bacterium]